MYVVDDCEHIDLYDRVDKIPFNKIRQFFDEAFGKEKVNEKILSIITWLDYHCY